MKKLFILITCISWSVISFGQARGIVDKKTKAFAVKAELADHYSVIGFAEPDRGSKKVILFSVFGNEVKDNPMNLPLGAYAETTALKEGERIEFDSESGPFVKLNFIHPDNSITPFYLARSFVKFSP